jgi:ABC-type iron transport system FetAB ATPase subunit
MEKYSKEDLFMNLINQFQQSVLIYLGKIKNPQNNKYEKNIALAEYFIFMLKMLQDKTKNNLNEHEEKNINQMIHQLDSYLNDEIKNGTAH